MADGYVWDGSTWRRLTSGWTWDGSVWKQITSGWAWSGGSWVQIFSSGTFNPLIQNAVGDTFANRGVGISMYGYRGSTATGTYNYTWQQAYGSNYDNGVWSTGDGVGPTGTLTGSTLLTPLYRTTAFDLGILANKIYNYKFYMRFKVVKGTETQYSPLVRIVKRIPSIALQTTTGTRSFYPYATFAPYLKNPYVGDTLVFWSSTDWNATSTDGTLANDIVPDYYIFEYTTGSGFTTKDSRLLDSTPSTPTNASKYIPVTGDLNYPVNVTITAYCSDVNTGTSTASTRNVDDGILKPPANLTLTFIGSILHGGWDDSNGGNANIISYRYELYAGSTLVATSVVGGNPVFGFNYTPTIAGLYYFRVRAEQTGSTTTDWAVSDSIDVQPPANFTYNITNITDTDLVPSGMTINAFSESTTILNQYNVSWNAPTYPVSSSTNYTYTDTWTYPSLYPPSTYSTGTATSDFWNVYSTGNHKLDVTVKQDRLQKVRISWTKPTGTTAVSYAINYTTITMGSPYTTTVNVEDVTNYDLLIDRFYTTTVQINSITAYSLSGQAGLSKAGAVYPIGKYYLTGSNLQVVSTATVSRTQYLTFLVVTAGTMSLSGDFESGGTITYSYNNDWVPAATDSRWSFTHTWGRTNNRTSGADTYAGGTGTTFTIPTSTSYIGEYFKLRTVANFISSSVFTNTSYTPNGLITTPAQPYYQLVNNYNNTFTISSVQAVGGDRYFGTYTGGTIPYTVLSSSYTSPVISTGTKTIDLYSSFNATYYTSGGSLLYTSGIDSRRHTATDIYVSSLPDFTYSISDSTVTPTAPSNMTYSWAYYAISNPSYGTRVDLSWNAGSNLSSYYSYINGGTTSPRGNYVTATSDFWSTVSGTSYTAYVFSVNTNGIARVSWAAVPGANSYKVNYTTGGTTTTSGATTNTYYDFPISITSGTGGTIGNAISPTVNNVTAFPTFDGSGQGKNGTVSGSRSVTVYQKNSTATSTGSFIAPTYVPAVTTPTALSAFVQSASIWVSFSGGTGDFYDVYYANSDTRPIDGQAFADFPGVTSPYNTGLNQVGIQRWFWVRKRTGTTYSNWYPAGSGATAIIPAPTPATAPGTPGTPTNGWTSGVTYPFSWTAPTPGTVSGGGAATITGYTMRVWEATSGSGTGATLRATINLGNVTAYTYTSPNSSRWYAAQVAATNSAGLTGNYSGISAYK